VAYVMQARAITHGRLFPVPVQPADAHRIWFFVLRPAGLVSKYLPLVSAVFALSLLLTGSLAPLLAVQAAVLPWLVAGLADEVGLRGRQVVVAAALVALSPLVLMESALPLSYELFLVLMTATWWLVLRLGHRRGGHEIVATIGIGLLTTAAAATRPFDTVLLLAPPLLWAAWCRRGDAVRLGLALVAGALPLVVSTGIYDDRATGAPWRAPFNLLEPSDKIGFGLRRLFPEQDPHHFGPVQGLIGLGVHFGLGLLTWLVAGVVLVPAAALAWRRSGPAARALVAATVAYLAGYWMFWGPWNFSVLWGDGTRVLGPIYAMAVTVPIVVTGLPVALSWMARHGRWVRVVVALLMVVGAAQLVSAVDQAGIDAGRTSDLLDLAARSRAQGPLLFDTDPPYLGHPVSNLVDGIGLSAYTDVPAAGTTPPQLLQLPEAVYGPHTLNYALTREDRVEAGELDVRVSILQRHADVLVVERGGHTRACALAHDSPDRSEPSVGTATIRITTTDVLGCDDAPVPAKWQRQTSQRCTDTSCVMLAVFRVDHSGATSRLTLRMLPVSTTGTSVAMLEDATVVASSGDGWLRVSAA
jgi:hypothetical protein